MIGPVFVQPLFVHFLLFTRFPTITHVSVFNSRYLLGGMCVRRVLSNCCMQNCVHFLSYTKIWLYRISIAFNVFEASFLPFRFFFAALQNEIEYFAILSIMYAELLIKLKHLFASLQQDFSFGFYNKQILIHTSFIVRT